MLCSAQDWQAALSDAHQLMAAGNVDQAMAAYQEHAEQGNPLAEFALGWQLKLNAEQAAEDERPPLRRQACQWFEKASTQHIPVAMQETGHCYRDRILPDDAPLETALLVYTNAGQNGLPAAFCDVMTISARLNKPYTDAMAHCEAVASQGAIYAQRQLIALFAASKDTAQQALYWLSVAAQKNGPEAYQYGMTLAQSDPPSPEQALYWLEHAASLGFLPAYLETAARYLQKIKPDTPVEQASQWLAKAYVWSNAWQQRVPSDIEKPDWIANVQASTPDAWQDELNAKVAQHIAKLSEPSG
ncbi:hypothetical protein LJ739_06425 [Aestuariibacter halophilus]|uniref:Sel1 repeat family protein n=1 Tax=Fluctibacter halophilus TaxID=226011 RepID=A0ABS8G7U0_9ALTE|nr:hypothetical protein [Aestuariibacter halophilus]MCC2615870.1 hypothetical protein [Aestuariibacter halophilus]